MSELVLYETHDNVAVITLNRADAMNAFNRPMRQALGAAQQKAEHDESIRVVMLTGTGNCFSSGTDLKEALGQSEIYDISVTEYKPLIDHIENSKKTYLAAINGVTGGVALGMAMACDLTTMSDQATMFSPFSNISFVPDGGTTWYFLNYLGRKKAFEAIAECTHLDAKTCMELGMINKIFPNDELKDQTLEWAKSIAKRAPLTLMYTKRLLKSAATTDRESIAHQESEYQNRCIRSEDAKSAVQAFFSKQKPVFKGK
ncbi:MAG: enoyl-CoA hydratase/isomerase family protein [Pseudomonadota bacterium]